MNYLDMTPEQKQKFDEDAAVRRKHEMELEAVQRQVREQQGIVRQLYSVIVRGMVVLKYLIRAGACVAAWYLLGHYEAYLLVGFILITGAFQLVIDKTRKVVHPELKLSEWDVL
jgi:hypothetical protein